MIDHVLGRPSGKFRKVQVLAVLSFWSLYLFRGNSHGPPLIRRISNKLGNRLTAWQTFIMTMLWLYFARNFAKIFGLESPEPLANLYSRSYFRATWVMTALDAGFWTAMTIRRKWLRDLASIVFSVYYLIAAEQADEKVRRVRATITVDHLRVSWNKSRTPYLKVITAVLHPLRNRYAPRHICVQRPKESGYREPVDVYLYYEGTREELLQEKKVVLDFPGGGFVAMGPRNHDDKLMDWSRRLRIPVLSVEYKKAPEYPYPYALNECYDVYHSIISTNGKCIGLSGETCPKIAISGDSAGGNFAAGVTLMILNSSDQDIDNSRRDPLVKSLPPPDGVLLIYPSLDLNIGSWMTEEQTRLIRKRNARNRNANIVRRKSEYLAQASGVRNPTSLATPHSASEDTSDDDEGLTMKPRDPKPTPPRTQTPIQHLHVLNPSTPTGQNSLLKNQTSATTYPPTEHDTSLTTANNILQATKPQPLSTRLAMTSRLSYFNDRILTPEMMRAMVILYIGPHHRPDFSTDFLLSPIVAPESLLARFPKCYFLTGERDPLVDDTVIFAARIREAKLGQYRHKRELGLLGKKEGNGGFEEKEHLEVRLIPGISHGFLLMGGVFPEARREIGRCGVWLGDILGVGGEEQVLEPEQPPRERHHYRRDTETSAGTTTDEDEEAGGLVMTSFTTTSTSNGTAVKPRSKRRYNRKPSPPLSSVDGMKKEKKEKEKSLRALRSEEDLVGRRMEGLMGGLTGVDRDEGY